MSPPYQAGGDPAAWQGGGPKKLRLAEHQEALREHLENAPDADLAERCEHLAKTEGVHVSVPTLWRAMRALGFTRKKTFSACEQDPLERMAWRWQQTWL